MRNEFTSIIEADGEWFIGYCPEIPGQMDRTHCRRMPANLSEAIALILKTGAKTVCVACRVTRFGKRLSWNETQLVVAPPT